MLRAIIAPESMAGSFVVLFVGGVLFYLFTSGTSYLYYCVWRRERFFPGWDPNTPEERKVRRQEWRWAFYNLFGNAVVTAPIHHLIVTGRSRIYFGIGEHGARQRDDGRIRHDRAFCRFDFQLLAAVIDAAHRTIDCGAQSVAGGSDGRAIALDHAPIHV